LHLKVFQFISSRIPLFIFFSSKSWENNSWKALWRLKSQQVDGGGYAGDPLIWPYIFCWHNFLCPKRTKRTEPEMSASPCSCRSRRPCGGWPVKRGAGNTLYVLLNLKIWKLFMSMWKLNSGPHKRDLFVRLGLIRSMQWMKWKGSRTGPSGYLFARSSSILHHHLELRLPYHLHLLPSIFCRRPFSSFYPYPR